MLGIIILIFFIVIIAIITGGKKTKAPFNSCNDVDIMYKRFCEQESVHAAMCSQTIELLRCYTTPEDLAIILVEMQKIRMKYRPAYNIDNLLFSKVVNCTDAIKLFYDFQNDVENCTATGNPLTGYSYVAWSITLMAHINRNLEIYGTTLWEELRRGFSIYEKNTLEIWKDIPEF